MSIVAGESITFNQVERTFFEMGCEIARTLMEQYLVKMDKELAEGRDKKEFRHKGCRSTSIKTLMGEVKLNRVLYKRFNEAGSSEHLFLLDQALGLETIGNISPNLVEKILEQASEVSYREAAAAVNGLTNQSISHQGVWNVVQAAGEQQVAAEKQLVKANEAGQISGAREVRVLFEEADGLWLSIQGKGKKREKGSTGKKELKIGVVYEGWEKRYPGSKEYRTVEKMAVAGYMKPPEFKALRDAVVAQKYNVDEIAWRILNGDGATWIRNGHDQETDVFQLDPYHLAKSVVRSVRDKAARGHILRWLKGGEFEKAFEKIETLKHECGGVVGEVKKLSELETYIRSNRDGIVSYRDRKEIKLPEPPPGVEFRTLGTMERNVNVFAKRMKGGKSWSEKGATHLAKIIALKMAKGFHTKISGLLSGQVSERLTERFEAEIRNVQSNSQRALRKSIYPLHRGEIPYTNSKMTAGRKVIRSLFDLKPFSELAYR